ncbi:aspartate dehydrogenase [Nocardioides ginsengisoli]|uniref:L-aspartate dehydrogenase n=1 Tax=Nocardioides ginsengisoli TaxID=363868 RepID=A0ABW3W5E5_9ACTN
MTRPYGDPVRVAVIGGGAIGASVVAALREGRLPGVVPVAVVDGRSVGDLGVPQLRLEAALDQADVVVECAGQSVIAQSAADILNRGIDLLISSVGALADPEVAAAVRAAGPGRFVLTAGAIGGLDILSSAAAQGPMTRVEVTTTKLPATLVQPWMDDADAERLRATTAPVEVFHGNAREATRMFPRSLNVAATLGWVVGDFDKVDVRLIADPAADLTCHHVRAEGEAGRYSFEIRNLPSAENPRTSGVVPHAVLRSLAALVGRPTGVV